MARGKLLRTKIKEALLEASLVQEAVRVGSIKAEQKEHAKKSIFDSIREHIGKGIDRVDPLELAAVLGATVLIKSGIDWVQVNQTSANQALMIALTNPFAAATLWALIKTSGLEGQPVSHNELMEWLVSFVAAYVIVHNFGKIVEVTGKIASDILGMAKSLLGVVPAVA